MIYHAVGDRIAYDLLTNFPIKKEEVRIRLEKLGFLILGNPQQLLADAAWQCFHNSRFQSDIDPTSAPFVVNCCSFIKWCYGQIGIWLPNSVLQQFEISKFGFGGPLADTKLRLGDLIFKRGRIKWHSDMYGCDVGHVGIVTEIREGGDGLVAHVIKDRGVIESPLKKRFVKNSRYRGARWIVPDFSSLVTLIIPNELKTRIETSYDVTCRVLATT